MKNYDFKKFFSDKLNIIVDRNEICKYVVY